MPLRQSLSLRFGFMVFCALPFGAFGQSEQSSFENALSAFYALRQLADQSGETPASAVQLADADSLFRIADTSFSAPKDSFKIFKKYLVEENRYQYAKFLLGNKDKSRAFQYLLAAQTGIKQLSYSDFPMRYDGLSKSFVIYWSDAEQMICQFNAVVGSYYYEQKNMEEALLHFRSANEQNCLEGREKALVSDQIMRIKTEKGEMDEELLGTAIALFETWNNLDAQTREALPALKDVPSRVAEMVEQILIKEPTWSDNGEISARIARLLIDEHEEAKAMPFAVSAIKLGYSDKEFLLAMFPLADRNGEKAAARLAADTYAAQLGQDDCDDLTLAAAQYKQLKELALAEKYEEKAENCQKRQARQTKVAGRDGGLYLGTYIFPWLRSDWGAVAAIQTRRHLIEFSWQDLDDRRDKLYDLRLRGVDGAADQRVRWDGYYAHVAVNRIRGKKGGKTYSGTLLGYNYRAYQPITVPEVKTSSGNLVNTDGRPVVFRPKEERYIMMVNGGRHSYGRILASDFYFSIGGAWAKFERGNSDFDQKDYSYNNPLLDRRKRGRFVPMMRVGMTVGLQFGPRLFEKKENKKGHS